MEKLFDICVEIMKYLSAQTGFTYKEINILIFVIAQPAVTLYYIIRCSLLKYNLAKIKKQNGK